LVQAALVKVGDQGVQRPIEQWHVVALVTEMVAVCIPNADGQGNHRDARLDQSPGQQKLAAFPAAAAVRVGFVFDVAAVPGLHFGGFAAQVERCAYPAGANHIQRPELEFVHSGDFASRVNIPPELVQSAEQRGAID
jgi:hypothetical protein